jgi:hypothetical protein
MENLVYRLCIWLIRRGYGANCRESDLDEFPGRYKNGKLSENIRNGGRCASCRAKEAIDFLEDTIKL